MPDPVDYLVPPQQQSAPPTFWNMVSGAAPVPQPDANPTPVPRLGLAQALATGNAVANNPGLMTGVQTMPGGSTFSGPPPAIQMPTQEIASPAALDGSSDLVTFGANGAPNSGVPPLQTVNVPMSNTSLVAPAVGTALDANTAAQMAALSQQEGGVDLGADVEEKERAAKAEGLGEIAQEKAGQAGQEKEAADKDDTVVHQILDQQDKLKSQLAAQKVDPDRWWNSLSAGEQVGRTIGKFLFTGGKLDAALGAKSINEHIERDIDAQKKDLETGQQGWENGNNLLARLYQAQGSKREAELHLHGLLTSSAQDAIDQGAALAGTGSAKAKANVLKGQLEVTRQEKARGGIEDYVKTHRYDPGGLRTTGTAPSKEDVARAVNVAGETYLAPDKEAAAKLRPEIAAYTNADRMLKRAQELRQDPNWSPFTPGNPQQRELEDISGRLPLAIHADGVRLNPEIISRLEQTTKNIASSRLNPGAWGIDAALAAHRRTLQDELGTTLAAQPLEHVKRGVAANPTTGGIMRTQADTGRDFIPAKTGRGAPPPSFTPIQ